MKNFLCSVVVFVTFFFAFSVFADQAVIDFNPELCSINSDLPGVKYEDQCIIPVAIALKDPVLCEGAQWPAKCSSSYFKSLSFFEKISTCKLSTNLIWMDDVCDRFYSKGFKSIFLFVLWVVLIFTGIKFLRYKTKWRSFKDRVLLMLKVYASFFLIFVALFPLAKIFSTIENLFEMLLILPWFALVVPVFSPIYLFASLGIPLIITGLTKTKKVLVVILVIYLILFLILSGYLSILMAPGFIGV